MTRYTLNFINVMTIDYAYAMESTEKYPEILLDETRWDEDAILWLE